mmetsp:Transcript_15092/g.30336  ORF Transcript_15092/g.30336 Transcript_15092/m.30336 type:complete len:84 (+) Transcript_15092:4122-4373(+)
MGVHSTKKEETCKFELAVTTSSHPTGSGVTVQMYENSGDCRGHDDGVTFERKFNAELMVIVDVVGGASTVTVGNPPPSLSSTE